jgi:hypothetical protein
MKDLSVATVGKFLWIRDTSCAIPTHICPAFNPTIIIQCYSMDTIIDLDEENMQP